MENKKIVIGYYLKGKQGKQYKKFNTEAEAKAFMQAMELNPACIAYGRVGNNV